MSPHRCSSSSSSNSSKSAAVSNPTDPASLPLLPFLSLYLLNQNSSKKTSQVKTRPLPSNRGASGPRPNKLYKREKKQNNGQPATILRSSPYCMTDQDTLKHHARETPSRTVPPPPPCSLISHPPNSSWYLSVGTPPVRRAEIPTGGALQYARAGKANDTPDFNSFSCPLSLSLSQQFDVKHFWPLSRFIPHPHGNATVLLKTPSWHCLSLFEMGMGGERLLKVRKWATNNQIGKKGHALAHHGRLCPNTEKRLFNSLRIRTVP